MGEERAVAPPIGEVLRRERLRRRLSLIEVGEQTRIHPRLLEAMENDDDRSLPAPVFAAGLITAYARFLRLDPAPIVAMYRARSIRSESTARRGARRGSRPFQLPGLVLPVLLVGLALGLGAYLYQQYATYVTDAELLRARPLAQAASIPPTPRAEADLVFATPTPTMSPTPVPTIRPATPVKPAAVIASTPIPLLPTATPPAPPTPTATAPREVKIEARASARVWVQVYADDKVVFSGILNAGDTRTWVARQSLLIWAGNGGSVEVTFNGKPLGPIGRPGEVVKVTWTTPP